MREVTQTRMGRPSGNCTEASIASVLDIDLAEVPDLWDPSDTDPEAPTFREAGFARLHSWLHERGLMYVQIKAPGDRAVARFRAIFGDRILGRPHLWMGVNPDGVGHCTVAVDGVMVWDPNPLRRGVQDVDEVVYLLPVEWLPDEYRDWPGVAYKESADG